MDDAVRAAKDFSTVEDFYKYENQSEDKVLKVREPAREFARKILPQKKQKGFGAAMNAGADFFRSLAVQRAPLNNTVERVRFGLELSGETPERIRLVLS